MRIIAGKHRGRKILMPKEVKHVRPTSGFAREAIFNILSHGQFAQDGQSAIRGQRILDVFCGSGAFGLEALSRGAAHVTFIDSARDSLAIARENAQRMGELDNVEFVQSDAAHLPRSRMKFSLAFLDPPYGGGLMAPTIESLLANGWLAKDALVVMEHDEREAPKIPDGVQRIDERRYGRSIVGLYRVKPVN